MRTIRLKIIIHPHINKTPALSNLRGEFELVSADISDLDEHFTMEEIAFNIERAINEHARGLRAHISVEN